VAAQVYGGKTVAQWEATIAVHNSNTAPFLAFVKAKLEAGVHLLGHCATFIYRQLRWWGEINRRRADDLDTEAFKRALAPDGSGLRSADFIIGMGDWSEDGHLKGMMPTKGRDLTKRLQRAGFKVLMVNECNTSKGCFACKRAGCVCAGVEMPNPKVKQQEGVRLRTRRGPRKKNADGDDPLKRHFHAPPPPPAVAPPEGAAAVPEKKVEATVTSYRTLRSSCGGLVGPQPSCVAQHRGLPCPS